MCFFIIKPIFLHKKSRRLKTSALLKKCCSVFLYHRPQTRGFIFYTKPDNEILFFEKFFLILFPEVYDKQPIPTKLTLHFSQAAFPGGLVLTFPQASSIPQEPISILSLKIIRRTPPIHRWLQPDFTTICSDKPSPPWILRNGKQKSV